MNEYMNYVQIVHELLEDNESEKTDLPIADQKHNREEGPKFHHISVQTHVHRRADRTQVYPKTSLKGK